AVADGSPIGIGARVAIHHHAPCGECRRCRRGHETLCERFRATGLDPGGFAEQVRVPAELVGELLELPDSMDPVAATFIAQLACVLRSQDGAERHGNELVDGAIVCTPKPDAIARAAAALAPGGSLCIYAPPAPDAPPP